MSAPLPRPGILDIAAYVPGASAIPGRSEVMKLSSNEGALGPSPRAIAAYKRMAETLHRYPDGDAGALRRALGARHGLDPDRIVCGAGSDQLIALIIRAFAGPGDEVLYSRYAFSVFGIFALGAGATLVTADEPDLTVNVDNVLAKVSDRTRIVYLANPNNPTGTYIAADELKRLRAGLREDILLLIDSAYAEFVVANDYSPGIELVDQGANTVMTRTFSKIYALGGLRIGWAYCPPAVVDVLHRLREPFNVSVAANAAGVAAVEDSEFFARSRDHNNVWLPWLRDRITEAGLEVVPSAANFVLVRFPDDERRNAKAAMAFFAERGIIPRDTTSSGLPGYIRITIGREHEMRAAAEAVAQFMS